MAAARAPGEDFFDDFGKGEGLFTTEEQHDAIRAALLLDGGDGASGGDLQARLRTLLLELAGGRYATLEEAQRAHPLDPYLRAASDPEALEAMRGEAAAAAKCAADAEAERQGGSKGAWEPPPEDAEPETAQDYE
jgi:hypothetical protein